MKTLNRKTDNIQFPCLAWNSMYLLAVVSYIRKNEIKISKEMTVFFWFICIVNVILKNIDL